MAQTQSGDTARPTYRQIDGEKVSTTELEEGDLIAVRVRWFDDFDRAMQRAVHMRVTQGAGFPVDVVAEGTDGHTYKFIEGRPHVECLSDEKEGYHRGMKTGPIKRID